MTLPDALAILELMEARDDDRFDKAAVRWAGRLALETPGLTLAELARAAAALDALPDTEAPQLLAGLASAAPPARPGAHGGRRGGLL